MLNSFIEKTIRLLLSLSLNLTLENNSVEQAFMPLPDLKYDYYQAIISSIISDSETMAEFTIEPSPLIYPNAPKVKLKFSEIMNTRKVFKMLHKILAPDALTEGVYTGYIFKMLDYDKKKKSTENKISIFMDIQGVGHFTLHAHKFEMEEL